jgi:hypothetical protein
MGHYGLDERKLRGLYCGFLAAAPVTHAGAEAVQPVADTEFAEWLNSKRGFLVSEVHDELTERFNAANGLHDAYRGAREEMLKWKMRAQATPAGSTGEGAEPVTTSATGGNWFTEITYVRRLGDVIQLLCGGQRPDDKTVADYLDRDQDSLDLQDFCAAHGPAWAQGIAVIDAAYLLADQPTEGVDHEMREDAAPSQPVADHPDTARLDWIESRHRIDIGILESGKHFVDTGNILPCESGLRAAIDAALAQQATKEGGDRA